MPQSLKKYWYAILVAAITLAGTLGWRAMCGGEFDDIWFSMISDDPLSDTGADPSAHKITTWGQMVDLARLTWLVDNGRLANYVGIVALNKCPLWLQTALGAITLTLIPLLMLALAQKMHWRRQAQTDIFSRWAFVIGAYLLFFWAANWEYMHVTMFFVNYYPGVLFMLAAIIMATASAAPMGWRAIGALAVAFVAGMWNEATALPVIVFLGIYWLATRRRWPLQMAIAAAVGLLAQLSSYGEWQRLLDNDAVTLSYADFLRQQLFKISTGYWLVGLYAVAYLPCRKRLNSSLMLALNGAIIAGIVLQLAVRGATRMSIPVVVLAAVGLLAVANALIRHRRSMLMKVAILAVTAAYGVMWLLVALWQQTVANDRDAVYAQLWEDRTTHFVFADIAKPQDIPGLIRHFVNPTYLEVGSVWNACPPQQRTHYVCVLPADCRGKAFDQWPAVPGDNQLRGSVYEMVSRQKIDTMFVRATFGELRDGANPLWRAIAAIKGTPETLDLFCTQRQLGTYQGDTLYGYQMMMLPRTVADRVITSIQVVPMPEGWSAPIPAPIPDDYLIVGFREAPEGTAEKLLR